MVAPVRSLLERAGAEYDYLNISRDNEARARLREIANGYESVPTLVFADGSALIEPSVQQVEAKLTEQGYTVAPATPLQKLQLLATNPFVLLAGLSAVIIGIVSGIDALIFVGMAIVAVIVLARMLMNLEESNR